CRRHDHSAGVRDGWRTHYGRIGDIAIVHLVLPFLGFIQTIETQLKSDIRNARPLQHHADDPADVTVPDDNDVLMEHSAQRLERQVGWGPWRKPANQFVSKIDQHW